MALSDLAVFSEWVYSAQTEVIRQQVELFNAASQGTITLSADPFTGDYSDRAFWQKVSGLVKRRNPYGSGAVTPKELEHLVDTMVKIAAGTPPVNIPPSMFEWILRSPEEGGAVIGQQLAGDTLADMLNSAIAAGTAAIAQVTALVTDISAATAPADLLGLAALNTGQSKFGDQYQDIRAWVMHSKPLFDIYGAAIANSEGLFVFGTIAIRTDPFGRVFVITDSPGLIVTGTPNKYESLGLVPGAITVARNNDFTDNVSTLNGDENIKRTYQAEWSFNLGLKGFSWDKANGGKAPDDINIATAANWDRYATSDKDLLGVLIISH